MNFIEEKILEKINNGINPVLRFPPEPNFILHLGHAKSMCLNFGLAEKYNGSCNLRFDDTNPCAEKSEYIDAILADIKWLGFNPSKIEYTSNYFDYIYNYIVTLINKGLAYVDDSTSEEIANNKGDLVKPGIDSIYRNRSIEDNLYRFENIKNGIYDESFCTLRLKIDMSSPIMCMRDPIIYRIIKEEHHNTGNKWCIYPMYDFAHPISDYIEGITDSLCTLEFELHRPLYNWILNNLDLENNLPEETEFARLNIANHLMSKRKFKSLIEEGYTLNDPRLLTLSGLKRRGYTPESIKNFCEIIGYTKRESVIDYKLLEECLRNHLNKIAYRYMCIFNPIKIILTNYEGSEICEIENNPENPNDGKREVIFTKEIYIENEDFREEADKKYYRLKLGGEVRLKGAYIIKANEIIKDSIGNIIEIRCTIDIDTKSGKSDRKVKGTIHWVSALYNKEIIVKEYEDLFLDNNCEIKNDVIHETIIYSELNIDNCEVGKAAQFVRNGYYTKDSDGTFIKTVSLKDSYKN